MKTKIWGCILGAVMFASALQSCQTQVEIPDGAVYPILFGSTETRAVADLNALKTNGFKVYAYFQGNVGGSASFANNVKHAVVEGLDVWSFETPEYWIPNTNYWFKAVYPGGIGNVDNDSSEQTFTISDLDISKQQDVMVATATASVAENATAPASGSVVNLQFKHLLACVEIKIKSSINVTINKITLNDIENFCKYSNGWQSNGNRTDLEITSDVELTPGADAQSVTGSILVVPIMTGYETITIEASNKTYSNISLPENTSWKNGRKYTYVAEIKQNDIIFNEPSVKVWDSESATGSVIIK